MDRCHHWKSTRFAPLINARAADVTADAWRQGAHLIARILGSALAYIAGHNGIRHIGATRAGVFIAFNPLTTGLCGAVLLGESLTAPMLLGGALILLGSCLCNKPLAPATLLGI